jgi:small-conductance mechanosensitive channel
MNRLIAHFAAAVLLTGLTSPAAALPLGEVAEPASSEPAAAPDIAQETGAQEDAQIARRISGIFAEIEGLERVSVDVSSGVVTLTGAAPGNRRDRAAAIAERVAGVVTVENDIERDLDVGSNVDPALGGLREKVTAALRAAPLVGIAVLIGLAIMLLGRFIAARETFWQRVMPNGFLAEMIQAAIRFVFVLLGIVVALDLLGATAVLGAVLGGAGIIGIALGFAMRDTVENYVASLMLSVRQPFRAGDQVVIDDLEGLVIRLTSRATVLMTLDGNHLRIPNSTVFKAVILNYTRNPQRRFDFELGIDAEDDPDAARALGAQVLSALDFVLDDPAPGARLDRVGDSNIVIQFLGWIDQRETDFYKARSRAIPAVKKALEEAGFALPEPIYRLRFDNGAPVTTGAGTAQPPKLSPRAPDIVVEETSEDVTPETHISEMVEKEREAAPEQASDLLDSHRPVE